VPSDVGSAAPDHTVSVLLVLAQSTGGIGRHVKTLAQGLAQRGVEVTVCAPGPTIAALDLDSLDARVVPAPLGSAAPAAVRTSRQVLRREAARVDLAHAHGLRAGADCVAFVPRTPLVVTWHNAPIGGRLWRLTHAALTRYVARSTDLTLAASDDLAADAKAAGAALVRSAFVTAPALGAARRNATQVRDELGVGTRPLVLAVGRLQRQKRLDVLVEAAAAWAGDDGSPVVVIAGDGPAGDDLAAQIAATHAPVRLLGARDDVADLLAAADVVALPSQWEARALVAQEALRAGVPLVTTAVGGLPSLLGDAAMTVPVGDAAALRAAIEEVLADPARRERMVTLGLARARSWPDEQRSLDDLVQTYLDLIRRVRLDPA
jgi:glycosyltransferase involved in cell wall biosynthesis